MKFKILFFLSVILLTGLFINQEAFCSEKIIRDISKQEALDKFGSPDRVGEKAWYYSGDEPVYVYFPSSPEISKLFIFPYKYDATLDVPFKIRAFVSYSDLRTEEITPRVKWSITKPQVLRKGKDFIPLSKGKAEVTASYKEMDSNVCIVNVEPDEEGEDEAEDNSIIARPLVLPDRPEVSRYDELEFRAFEGFFNEEKAVVEEITSKRNVEWFKSYKGKEEEQEDNIISFPNLGEVKVYCVYKGIKSRVQTVEVKNSVEFRHGIRTISVYPSLTTFAPDKIVKMRGFATYYNNEVEDLTADLSWSVSDSDIAEFQSLYVWPGKRELELKQEGIVDITAELEYSVKGTGQLKVKRDREGEGEDVEDSDKPEAQNKEEEIEKEKKKKQEEKNKEKKKKEFKDIVKEMKKSIENVSPERVTIDALKVKPAELELPLGRKGALKATLVFSNDRTTDVTSMVKWVSFDPSIAVVMAGKVNTRRQGYTKVNSSYKGVKSNSVFIKVNPPKLISISLDRYTLRQQVGSKFSVKATGHYEDNSKKDITGLVVWKIDGKNILDIKSGGVFKALKQGKTVLRARYKGVQSLPLDVEVFVPLMERIRNALFGIFLAALFLAGFLYSWIKIKVHKIKSIKLSDPDIFIEMVYDNFRKVMGVLGFGSHYSIPSMEYSRLIAGTYGVEREDFLRMAEEFTKAVYSPAQVSASEAQHFQETYNKCLKIIEIQTPNFFVKYFQLLFFRYPFIL